MQDFLFEHVRKHFNLNAMGGEDYVFGLLRNGHAWLWWDDNSAMITEIVDGHRLNVFGADGALHELASLWPQVEAWAVDSGCDCISVPAQWKAASDMLRADGYRDRTETGELVKRFERRLH